MGCICHTSGNDKHVIVRVIKKYLFKGAGKKFPFALAQEIMVLRWYGNEYSCIAVFIYISVGN